MCGERSTELGLARLLPPKAATKQVCAGKREWLKHRLQDWEDIMETYESSTNAAEEKINAAKIQNRIQVRY